MGITDTKSGALGRCYFRLELALQLRREEPISAVWLKILPLPREFAALAQIQVPDVIFRGQTLDSNLGLAC